MRAHRVQPGVVERRTAQQMIALHFAADKLPPQRDDIRQIQVVPLDLAIVHTLEARIEATPDMDNDCLRAASQEIPRVAVEFPVAEDQRHLFILGHLEPDPGEVIAHLRDQRHGPLVFDQGVRALRFRRSDVERDEQRFSHAAQVLMRIPRYAALLRVE